MNPGSWGPSLCDFLDSAVFLTEGVVILYISNKSNNLSFILLTMCGIVRFFFNSPEWEILSHWYFNWVSTSVTCLIIILPACNLYLNIQQTSQYKMPKTELLIFIPQIAIPVGSPFQVVSTSSFLSCFPWPNSWNYPLYLMHTPSTNTINTT